jgi:hypothetical protein
VSRAHEVIHDALWMSATPAKWRPGAFEDFVYDHDIKHVVALCNRPPTDASFGLHLDAPIDVRHCPVVDSHKTVAPEIPQVIVPWVVDWVRKRERTLVSCLAGRSRSGMTCALVIREVFDLSGEQALEQLRAGRPRAIKREGPEAWLKALPAPSEGGELPPEFGEQLKSPF